MIGKLLILAALSGAPQTDSTLFARLDSMVVAYTEALRSADTETKYREADFMISSCKDSLARQRVALKLYGTYLNSPVMGEEAVAVHLFDTWFAPGKVQMKSETDLLNARIYSDFNRATLIGMDAPVLNLENLEGGIERLPAEGKVSVLYFYDSSCSNCTAQTLLLPYVLDEADFEIDFYAVYAGSDRETWRKYVGEHFGFSNPRIRVHHLWDPEVESDYQRLYGVLATPKMYLVEPQGTILGRRLTAESLLQLLPYAGAVSKLYERYSSGSGE